MARSLTVAAKQAVFAQQTGEVFLHLLDISHPDLIGGPIRLVSDTVAVISGGNTYEPFPFEIDLPSDEEEHLSQAELLVGEVGPTIVEALRTITTPPSIDLRIVLASAPDTTVAGPFNFTAREVEGDATSLRLRLTFEDILNEPFPGDEFDPARFPGLFSE